MLFLLKTQMYWKCRYRFGPWFVWKTMCISPFSVQERTSRQRLRSHIQKVYENPHQNQCSSQTIALEQMPPILEKKEMAIKPHQHRKQEAKYGLIPSDESYSRGLRAMSPCSDSAALSHLLSSCFSAMAGPNMTPVESMLMLWVPLRAGLRVQHLQVCAPYSHLQLRDS